MRHKTSGACSIKRVVVTQLVEQEFGIKHSIVTNENNAIVRDAVARARHVRAHHAERILNGRGHAAPVKEISYTRRMRDGCHEAGELSFELLVPRVENYVHAPSAPHVGVNDMAPDGLEADARGRRRRLRGHKVVGLVHDARVAKEN